jgi:hypothetical protein
MDSYKPLLKAVIAALKADSTVSGLVGARIYSNVPQNETFPYIMVSISSLDFSSVTFSGQDHAIQINAYSREADPEEVADIKSACYNVLHRNESGLTLDSGTLSIIQFDGLAEIFKDNDGITWEAVTRFRAVVT